MSDTKIISYDQPKFIFINSSADDQPKSIFYWTQNNLISKQFTK